jgi:hypothetical protein
MASEDRRAGEYDDDNAALLVEGLKQEMTAARKKGRAPFVLVEGQRKALKALPGVNEDAIVGKGQQAMQATVKDDGVSPLSRLGKTAKRLSQPLLPAASNGGFVPASSDAPEVDESDVAKMRAALASLPRRQESSSPARFSPSPPQQRRQPSASPVRTSRPATATVRVEEEDPRAAAVRERERRWHQKEVEESALRLSVPVERMAKLFAQRRRVQGDEELRQRLRALERTVRETTRSVLKGVEGGEAGGWKTALERIGAGLERLGKTSMDVDFETGEAVRDPGLLEHARQGTEVSMRRANATKHERMDRTLRERADPSRAGARAAADAVRLISRELGKEGVAALDDLVQTLRVIARTGDLGLLARSGVPGAGVLAKELVSRGLVTGVRVELKHSMKEANPLVTRQYAKTLAALEAKPGGARLRPASARTTKRAPPEEVGVPLAMEKRFGRKVSAASGTHDQGGRDHQLGDIVYGGDPAKDASMRMSHWAPDTRRSIAISGRLMPYQNLKKKHLLKDLALPQPSSAARHSGADLPAAPPKPGTLESLTLAGGAALLPPWRAASLREAERMAHTARVAAEAQSYGRQGIDTMQGLGTLRMGEDEVEESKRASARLRRLRPGSAPPAAQFQAIDLLDEVAVGVGEGGVESAPVPLGGGAALVATAEGAFAAALDAKRLLPKQDDGNETMRSARQSQTMILGVGMGSTARHLAAAVSARPTPGTFGRTALTIGEPSTLPVEARREELGEYGNEDDVMSAIDDVFEEGEVKRVAIAGERGRLKLTLSTQGPGLTVAELYGVRAALMEDAHGRGGVVSAVGEGMAWRGATGGVAAPMAAKRSEHLPDVLGRERALKERARRHRRQKDAPPVPVDFEGTKRTVASRLARRAQSLADFRRGTVVRTDNDAEEEEGGAPRVSDLEVRRAESKAFVSQRRQSSLRARREVVISAVAGSEQALVQTITGQAEAAGPNAAVAASLGVASSLPNHGGAGGSDARLASDRFASVPLLPSSRAVRGQAARVGGAAVRPVSANRQVRRMGGTQSAGASMRYDLGLSRRVELLGVPGDAPDEMCVRTNPWMR